MELSTLIAIITILSILIIGLSMRYSSTPRGGVHKSRQLPVWRTNTPPKVRKPRRWRDQIYASQPTREGHEEAA